MAHSMTTSFIISTNFNNSLVFTPSFKTLVSPPSKKFTRRRNRVPVVVSASLEPVSEVFTLAAADLDPGTAKIAIGILTPFLSSFGFLFILRIVMSWYPKLPLNKFPYVLAYAPTEPILVLTRKVIPPLAGVDVTPVVWFGLLSFLSEILVGPQGLLVLVSQQQG